MFQIPFIQRIFYLHGYRKIIESDSNPIGTGILGVFIGDFQGEDPSDEFTAIAIRTQQAPAVESSLNKTNTIHRLSPAEALGLLPQ